jgi:outer membrane protein assembly factor BamA
VSAFGAQGSYDTRNDWDEPTNGTLGEIQAMFSRGWLGSSPQFNWYRGWINQYVALSSHDAVLALRLQGCSVGSAAPVWEYCLYGLSSDLRGYAAGRYRDKTMFTGQAEFRIPIVDRFGAVAFGGVGAVAPSFSAVAMNQLLPAGGVGLRYLVYEAWHVKVGVDGAWGRNGGAFYLRLGEAY